MLTHNECLMSNIINMQDNPVFISRTKLQNNLEFHKTNGLILLYYGMAFINIYLCKSPLNIIWTHLFSLCLFFLLGYVHTDFFHKDFKAEST